MHGPNCKLGNFCTVGRRLQEVNVLGGLILPVWGTIEKALSKQANFSFMQFKFLYCTRYYNPRDVNATLLAVKHLMIRMMSMSLYCH